MPPSLPPSPPASEQSETEQPSSHPRVSSARVTRSQTRAREKAGLPSLLVDPLTPTPIHHLSDIVHVDEVGRIPKHPRLLSAPSEDSDDSPLFHPSERPSGELPEPGPSGAGSSVYHSLVPPGPPEPTEDEFHAALQIAYPSRRTIL
eukprot:3716193-Pleurochrysis_carterae.AAC.1